MVNWDALTLVLNNNGAITDPESESAQESASYKRKAAEMSEHIYLDLIDPAELSKTVKASGW
jgi:predicted membrane-bound spermidine synthase